MSMKPEESVSDFRHGCSRLATSQLCWVFVLSISCSIRSWKGNPERLNCLKVFSSFDITGNPQPPDPVFWLPKVPHNLLTRCRQGRRYVWLDVMLAGSLIIST